MAAPARRIGFVLSDQSARPRRVEHRFNAPPNSRRGFRNARPQRLQDFKHRRRVDFMHRPRAQRRTIPLQRHFPLGAMLSVAPLGLLGGQEIIRDLPERQPPSLGQPVLHKLVDVVYKFVGAVCEQSFLS